MVCFVSPVQLIKVGIIVGSLIRFVNVPQTVIAMVCGIGIGPNTASILRKESRVFSSWVADSCPGLPRMPHVAVELQPSARA